MKIRWLLQVCIVLGVGMGLASCTKAEIEQAMNRPAEIMLQSSPCTPAGIASTATPEFCINVMEIQLTNQDTQADVSLTLVNRTGRRHFIYVSGMPFMIDSSGAKWLGRRHTGLGSGTHYPVPVEPNVETQGSITFYQSGPVTTDVTFSMRGEITIMQVDSRGQPIPFKILATRGFNISGIRLPQPPPQSSAPAEQNQDSKLAQTSPQSVAPATPKASASSQATAPAAIAGASGSGNPSSQKPASSNASSSSDKRTSPIATPAEDAVTSKSGSTASADNLSMSNNNNSRKSVDKSAGLTPVPTGYSIPAWADRLDIVGVKIGMPADQAVQVLKSHNPKFTIKTEQVELPNVGIPSAWVTVAQDVANNAPMEYVAYRIALPPQPSVVIEITRYVFFAKGKEPTFTSVMESLQAKYGNNFVKITRNSVPNPQEPSGLYILRLDGQRVEQPKQGGCHYDLNPISPHQRGTLDHFEVFSSELRDGRGHAQIANLCGIVVAAVISPVYQNEKLVSSLQTRVSNEPFRASSLQKTIDYLNRLEQARKDKEAGEREGIRPKM